jgi:hypothetical protein
MSYDLYCYRSALGKPNLEEAQRVTDDEKAEEDLHPDDGTKLTISKALMSFNPWLEIFELDDDKIAKPAGISAEDTKQQLSLVELNTTDGELATQITIFNNYLIIAVPYLYLGRQAKSIFDQIAEYTKIIYNTTGYFVYDPQTEKVYNPATHHFDGLKVFRWMMDDEKNNKATGSGHPDKKPWWKFW